MVMVSDKGRPFGLDDLRTGGRGGNRAIKDLEEHAGQRFSVRYRFHDDRNQWSIIDESSSGGTGAPCSLVLDVPRDELHKHIHSKIKTLVECAEIHIYGGFLWSYSDWASALRAIRNELETTRIVIHGLPRESHLAAMIQKMYEPVEIID
jgi:hypothetical protein